MAKYIDADTVVSMPFLDDCIEKHTMETDTIENLLDRFTKEGCPESADVVPVSAYKQVMLERDTVVEQLKQIGKDIREVMDDVMHLQKRLLSADVAQMRHSRWIKTEDGAECEKCGREAVYQIVDDHWEYEPWCPHCGSKMDKVEEDNDKS